MRAIVIGLGVIAVECMARASATAIPIEVSTHAEWRRA